MAGKLGVGSPATLRTWVRRAEVDAGRRPGLTSGPDGVEGVRWGVEPMCTVLSEHGIQVAPATYYEWVDKQPTPQQLRDEHIAALIRAEREDPKTGKFASTLGSCKMWLRLRGKGHDVARCTIERLMRENGWERAAYGREHVTTVGDPKAPRHPDLVDRNFSPAAPNRLWVADSTYAQRGRAWSTWPS